MPVTPREPQIISEGTPFSQFDEGGNGVRGVLNRHDNEITDLQAAHTARDEEVSEIQEQIDVSLNDDGTLKEEVGVSTGWIPASEAWTYVSYDDTGTGVSSTNGVSTGVFYAAGNMTNRYSPGMRVKFTQTTVRFGIITAVSSYDAGNDRTSITIYCGTQYTLSNATITNPYYSLVKAPLGFPLNPAKWTVESIDSGFRTQSSPTVSTWYNLNSNQLALPIGCWHLGYSTYGYAVRNGTTVEMFAGLSTANNSMGDRGFVAQIFNGGATSSALATQNPLSKEGVVEVAAKTPYYLNVMTGLSSTTSINIGSSNTTQTRIYARCVYI